MFRVLKRVSPVMVWFVLGYILAWGEEPLSINKLLPKGWQERVEAEVKFRYRLEQRHNFDFNSGVDDNDTFHLFRSRLNLGFHTGESTLFFLQLQDSRIREDGFGNRSPFEDDIEVRQAYIELGETPWQNFSLRIGRQELSYGKERLIGGFNWSNVAQSFDALKLIYRKGALRLDLFASRRALIRSNKWNRNDHDDNFFGLYGSYKGFKNYTLDFYYLFRDTDRPVNFGPNTGASQLDESTVGLRFEKKPGKGVDYELETAYQFGNFGGQEIRAWALVANVGYTFELSWSPRVGFEFVYATGDSDPNDSERNTFDNLFPTNHLHYGYMDRASLQNLIDYHFTVNAKPTKKLYLQADVHILRLEEATDSLYNAGRRPVRTSATSSVSKSIGSELDLLVRYKMNQNVSFLAGFSHFSAGDYLGETVTEDDADFFYFQATFRF